MISPFGLCRFGKPACSAGESQVLALKKAVGLVFCGDFCDKMRQTN
jgi:hypothetical protein